MFPLQCFSLEDGRKTKVLQYNYKKEGQQGRGVCNCATSTKRRLEACDADDKQSDTIIAWSLPHTADRFLTFSYRCHIIHMLLLTYHMLMFTYHMLTLGRL